MPEHHGGHQSHHAHMVADFRRRLWITLVLTVPVLALAPAIQSVLGLQELLAFPGQGLAQFVLASVVWALPSGREPTSQSSRPTSCWCVPTRATSSPSSHWPAPPTARWSRISGGRPATTSWRSRWQPACCIGPGFSSHRRWVRSSCRSLRSLWQSMRGCWGERRKHERNWHGRRRLRSQGPTTTPPPGGKRASAPKVVFRLAAVSCRRCARRDRRPRTRRRTAECCS